MNILENFPPNFFLTLYSLCGTNRAKNVTLMGRKLEFRHFFFKL
jgi:hypothetical protein